MSAVEYIAVATDRTGKVQDFAVCNAFSLARAYADQFAAVAPVTSVVTLYECTEVAVKSGRRDDTAPDPSLPSPNSMTPAPG